MSKKITLIILTISYCISANATLSGGNFEKAKECLGKRESNNNYSIINTLGYLGRYQFGAAALEDIGFLKDGCYKKFKNRIPNKCWTGLYDIYSISNYLSSHKAQDKALGLLFDLNHKKLLKSKVLNKDSSQSRIAQTLFVSHLLGTRGAYKYFKKNINTKDGYGTGAKEYSELAKTCIKD